jgi:hypothetical protein
VVPWPEVFIVFLVAHLFGDFALQTDWQAQHKAGGLGAGGPVARRALGGHVATYTLAFVPAVAWLWSDIGAAALLTLPLVAIPHLVQDDGRVIALWVRRVKGEGAMGSRGVMVAVDQSFHALMLFATALLVGAL